MSKTKDELLDEAEELGVDADESMTNAEIQAAIDEAKDGGGEEESQADEDGFDASKYQGVSPDRQIKPAEPFNNPVETEWEINSREAYQAGIDEANAEKEAQRVEAEEAHEAAARKRLTDFLGS